jgi:two-component system response regulator MtrA
VTDRLEVPSMRATRLLLVEDDPVIGEATKLNLERHGYDVTWVDDGLDAWHAFGAEPAPGFELVLSDVLLPGIDGVTLCRRIREAGTTPVVLISARSESVDIVGGLEAGADDYVTKPFDIQVLLARLRNVTRRSARAPSAEVVAAESAGGDDVVQLGDLTLDRRALELRRDGQPVALTPTEMRLFLELAATPGQVLSRRALLSRVWDYQEWEDDDHLVNVHVQRLRAKIGQDRIETVRGFGYKLRR